LAGRKLLLCKLKPWKEKAGQMEVLSMVFLWGMNIKWLLAPILLFHLSIAAASDWSMVVYKTSIKADCPEICGLEIFKDGNLVVSDLKISVRDPEQVSVQDKLAIEEALKNEGVKDSFEDILRSARIIDDVD
jgi:hypothetical protein